MFRRIFVNTSKQISRSGWSGWGSISVMTLAFLVASIFGGLAFISNKYIQFIERKSNVLVFFEVGMDDEVIDRLETKWKQDAKIKNIAFTSEDEAYSIYSDYTSKVRPEIFEVLKVQENKKLPSSLDIQIWSLDDLEKVREQLQTDINEELKGLIITELETTQESTLEADEAAEEELDATTAETEDTTSTTPEDTAGTTPDEEAEDVVTTQEPTTIKYKYSDDPNVPPITLKIDDENLDQLRDVFFALRITGIVIISLLFLVIFFFTFMTVEFRLSSQIEEIGVMQLVGGSLFFIRAPYILEGGFYGFMGSLMSSLMLGGVLTGLFVFNDESTLAKFMYENFSKLSLPEVSVAEWGLVILGLGLIGFLLGATSSYLSIRRYIR